MQAPHRPVPQPNLVPVSLSPSRITHNNGVCGGASVVAAWPFTVKLVVMVSSPASTAQAAQRHLAANPLSASHPAFADERRASHARFWVNRSDFPVGPKVPGRAGEHRRRLVE